jgi:hypothetical protein
LTLTSSVTRPSATTRLGAGQGPGTGTSAENPASSRHRDTTALTDDRRLGGSGALSPDTGATGAAGKGARGKGAEAGCRGTQGSPAAVFPLSTREAGSASTDEVVSAAPLGVDETDEGTEDKTVCLDTTVLSTGLGRPDGRTRASSPLDTELEAGSARLLEEAAARPAWFSPGAYE